MFIEQLKPEDYELLAFVLSRSYDTTYSTTKFNKDTSKLTIKEYGENEKYVFYLQDFKIIPASNLAAEGLILTNIEQSYYKFMKQKFGYIYELELSSYLNKLNLDVSTMLNQ